MSDQDTPRKNISIGLNPTARDVIERLREDTGVPNTEAMTRILEWFASLDRKLRLAILSRDSGTRDELIRLALREMLGLDVAAQHVGGKPITHDEGIRIMQKLLEQMHVQHIAISRELEDARKALKKKRAD